MSIALSLSHSLPRMLTLNYNVLKSRQFESFVISVAMVGTCGGLCDGSSAVS